MKSFWIAMMASSAIFIAPNLFACPSGQTCPAGKDCVADSTLCVSSSTSTTSSSGGTSSVPTTTKDQLGLTLEPSNSLVRVFQFNNQTKQWTFFDPRLEFESVNTLRSTKPGDPMWINVSQSATVQFDGDQAPIPLVEGWNLIVR